MIGKGAFVKEGASGIVYLRHGSAIFRSKPQERKQDLPVQHRIHRLPNPRVGKCHEKRIESQLTVALELIPTELTQTQNGVCRRAQRPCKSMLSRRWSLPTNVVVRAGCRPCTPQAMSVCQSNVLSGRKRRQRCTGIDKTGDAAWECSGVGI